MSGLRYTLVVRHPETAEPVALLQGQPVPEWAQDLVHADDYEPDGQVLDGDVRPVTKAELEAEIARRNEGRADEALIKPTGKNRPDLVAALEADDAALAAAAAGN